MELPKGYKVVKTPKGETDCDICHFAETCNPYAHPIDETPNLCKGITGHKIGYHLEVTKEKEVSISSKDEDYLQEINKVYREACYWLPVIHKLENTTYDAIISDFQYIFYAIRWSLEGNIRNAKENYDIFKITELYTQLKKRKAI